MSRLPSSELRTDVSPLSPSASCPAAYSNAEGGLDEPPMGQLILGVDKRNPVFAVYEDDSGERLLVFYGFEIIEIVKNDPETPAYKLLLGRLYNSGVKLMALCESFQVAPKTIRRWGKALLRGDPVDLIRVLEGRSAGRKRTVEVERFARLRWPELVAERRYGAVERLRREIQSVFRVSLSRSGLQSLIRELRAEGARQSSPLTPHGPESDGTVRLEEPGPTPPGADLQKGEIGGHCGAEASMDQGAHGAVNTGLKNGYRPFGWGRRTSNRPSS